MADTVETESGARWRSLLRAALILLIAVGVLVHVYVQAPIPPIILFLVLFGVVLYLLPREGRARTVGTVLGGVGALLFLVGNLPFVVEDLSHPDSFLAFVASAAGVVGSIVGFVAMLGALRGWNDRPVQAILGASGLLVGVIVVVGVVAMLGVDSDERQEGDVVLIAEDVDYFPEGEDPEREEDVQLTVEAGGAVFVENKDLYRHTFTIEALDLDEEVQASTDRRVVLEEAGEYEFFCDISGHDEDMRGTVNVR